MIPKEVWKDWIDGLLNYAKEYYPEANITEKRVIEFMFKSMRTIYMEPIIIDIRDFDNEE